MPSQSERKRPSRWRGRLLMLSGCVAWLLLAIAADGVEPATVPLRLTDVTAQSGITFRHTSGGSGQGYIVEGVVGGLALLDYDGDGWTDIYFLNGAPLKGTAAATPPRNTLYRNRGDGTFVDVTEAAGVGDTGHGLGVTAADFDNDGDPDLYVSNFGPNVLYRNNGDGTFTDVTADTGVGNGHQVGAGTSFFDMDGDGDLDLYAANYVNFTYDNHVPIVVQGHHFKAGPQYYQPVPDTLFRNEGDGTFTDVSRESGIAAVAGPSMGTICGDFDEDGDVDVFVANDGQADFLFLNDGQGRFRENGLLAGVAFNFFGKANSSMGVDAGDYDNDGRLDLFVTAYQGERPVLFRNLGSGFFEDATSAARISDRLFPHVHWGTGFVDFDQDGDRDLFVACGHFDEIERIDDRTAFRVPNCLMLNAGDGTFVDVSTQAGSGLAVVESSRGAVFDDLDQDGDVDVVVANSDALPTVLRNDSQPQGHWLQLQLVGTENNRDGVGARVRVVTGERSQVAEVRSGHSYQSHSGPQLHFGLGHHERIDRVDVRWPNGLEESFTDLPADQMRRLREGTGNQAAQAALR